MARCKPLGDALVRLLESAADPIYAVDDERTIVFCNRALADWTGVEPDDLIGRRTAYHSREGKGVRNLLPERPGEGFSQEVPDTFSPPGIAAGLSPPPAALAGELAEGHVSCMSRNGRLLHRRARFLPVGLARDTVGDECRGVMVFVAPIDLEATDRGPTDHGAPAADDLHVAVRRFRFESAQQYDIDRLVGPSPAVERARRQIVLAAESSVAVLIAGPPGSGRSHVARAIHYRSDASHEAPLVPLDCRLLTADVLRQAIEAGAPGRPAGSLLLLSIDELSEEVQTQLAELLRTRTELPRLLSTSTRRLDEVARETPFRDDLAYRLATLTVELPPLADRLEDLPLLAQLFLEGGNAESEKQIGRITPEALDLLALYPWRGGLDELADVIRAAHDAACTHEIREGDLPSHVRQAADTVRHPRRRDEPIVLDQFMAGIERELITRALSRAKGNKTRAAELLGMSRPRLYRRLVQLGLAGSEPAASED